MRPYIIYHVLNEIQIFGGLIREEFSCSGLHPGSLSLSHSLSLSASPSLSDQDIFIRHKPYRSLIFSWIQIQAPCLSTRTSMNHAWLGTTKWTVFTNLLGRKGFHRLWFPKPLKKTRLQQLYVVWVKNYCIMVFVERSSTNLGLQESSWEAPLLFTFVNLCTPDNVYRAEDARELKLTQSWGIR